METWVAKLHYLSFIVNLILQIRKWLMNCSYIRIPCLFDTEDEYGDAVDDGDRFEDNAVGWTNPHTPVLIWSQSLASSMSALQP